MESSGNSTRPRSRDGSSDVERRIFAATERALANVGARDLSVEQILAEAGVSRGTFYHYFSSKWEVINRLAANVMDDIYVRIQPFVLRPADLSPADALSRSIVEGCQVWAEHRAVVRAIIEHWRQVPEIRTMLLEVFERFIAGIADTIDRERASGKAPPGTESRRLATTLMWSSAYCLYLAGLDEIEDLPDEQAVQDSLLALWMGSLYGDPAASSG
jgi:AcrR family transcriptional regulator